MKEVEAEFDKTVQFLYSQLPMYQRDGASAYKKDLVNTVRLCEFLGQRQHQFKSVHIAGTNGKGSSAHYLAAICQTAGYKTGLYTSPHLKNFTERIKVNGAEIDKAAVVEFVNKMRPVIAEVKPSFFEITVAMCFDYFAREQVDIGIIEVGMGGRLDSTNVILPEVSLITNISLDHQQWLGNTIPEIAVEKAGIIKNNRPVVISERQDETESVFREIAGKHNAPLFFATDTFCTTYDDGFLISKDNGQFLQLSKKTGASYQLNNINGVVKTIEVLSNRGFNISNEHIKKGFEDNLSITGLKGRWQKIGEEPLTYCDVGHNESGIDYVLEQIKRVDYKRLYMVIGMVSDKDVTAILKKFPKGAYYYFCQANIPRAMDAYALASEAAKFELKGEVIKDTNKAVRAARTRANADDLVFIGGSNFVVAEIDNL